MGKITDDFGHWLAGFTDGEGCFMIHDRNDRGMQHTFWFVITLRSDDSSILQLAQSTTGLGRIHLDVKRQGNANPQSSWMVSRKAECLELTHIFDQFPLRSKKRNDYAIWREGIILWQDVPRGPQNYDWGRISSLCTQLREERIFRA